MKEIEYAIKTEEGTLIETGSVWAENLESGQEVEQGIKAQDNFKKRKGGRRNRVEAYRKDIQGHLDRGDLETAAYTLGKAEKKMSDTSGWRLRKKLDEKDVSKLREMEKYEQGKS